MSIEDIAWTPDEVVQMLKLDKSDNANNKVNLSSSFTKSKLIKYMNNTIPSLWLANVGFGLLRDSIANDKLCALYKLFYSDFNPTIRQIMYSNLKDLVNLLINHVSQRNDSIMYEAALKLLSCLVYKLFGCSSLITTDIVQHERIKDGEELKYM